ncbi:MAG: tetraacyldisaccharide 4'-kinase [Candidatus Omnitrophica bacterium]|nr:tetraacyldisaccharide 4'-kinase [Candidatus Omnitrophota bacterium]
MKRRLRMRRWYVSFLDSPHRSAGSKICAGVLFAVSLVYGAGVAVRNFLYQREMLPVYRASGQVISVGNLSWGGTGKTPLTMLLFRACADRMRTAVIRRGYGADEQQLYREAGASVYSLPQRSAVMARLEGQYELFVLDDAFQHRKVVRDIDIVAVTPREFEKPYLIPAGTLREPLSALRRADIILVNHCRQEKKSAILSRIRRQSRSDTPVFFASYRMRALRNGVGAEVPAARLRDMRPAAFAAVGYPEGFFSLLRDEGITVHREIAYPDHYTLGPAEYREMEEGLLCQGHQALLITEKDRTHLPPGNKRIEIIWVQAELRIEREKDFLDRVFGLLGQRGHHT